MPKSTNVCTRCRPQNRQQDVSNITFVLAEFSDSDRRTHCYFPARPIRSGIRFQAKNRLPPSLHSILDSRSTRELKLFFSSDGGSPRNPAVYVTTLAPRL